MKMNDNGSDGSYKLEEVENLGDLSTFVGSNRARSLSATDFPVLTPNFNYFTDNVFLCSVASESFTRHA